MRVRDFLRRDLSAPKRDAPLRQAISILQTSCSKDG